MSIDRSLPNLKMIQYLPTVVHIGKPITRVGSSGYHLTD